MIAEASPFAHEYDLGAVERIRPRGHEFQMLVTPRYREHLVARRYEPFAADLVAAAAPRTGVFVDVGAHYGFFSLLAAHRNPELEILACEPVPETLEVLRRGFALNGLSPDSALGLAVSDRVGRAELQISLSSDNCSFYSHPNAPPIRSLEVATTTVDALLADRTPSPLFVKIDTDGHELAVLAGMRDTLGRFEESTLLVELNPKMQRAAGHTPDELPATLDDLGFDAFLLDEERRLAYRLRKPADWRDRISDETSYANLYCVRRRRSLSVAFVSHSAGLAGAERSLLELVTELVADHGAMCTVVLPEDGPLRRPIEDAGGAVLFADLPWWCVTTGAPPEEDGVDRLTTAAAALLVEPRRTLERIAPHVVVTNTLAIPWGSFLAPLLGSPHVWHVCEYDDAESDLRFFLDRDDVRATVVASSSRVLTATRELARRYASLGAVAQALYRHIEVPAGPYPPSGLYRRPGALRLLTVGTVCRSKGQDLVVEAVERLVARGHDVELVLAGPPQQPFEDDLRRLVDRHELADRVHLAGPLDDVYPAMAEADVVVIGSRSDAFSRSAAESMLLGRALVYPRIGGPGEYLRDGETGLAFSAGDVEALTAAIERMAADPALRRRLGESARRVAKTIFGRAGYGGLAAQVLLEIRGEAPRLAPVWARLLPGIVEAALAQGREAEAVERAALHAAELRAAHESRDALVDDLRAARETRDALEAELRAAREIRDALEADLRASRDARDAEAAELARVHHEAAELRQEIARLEPENADLRARAALLGAETEELLAEVTRARQRLDAVYASRTWRAAITLRRPLDLIRRAERSLRGSTRTGSR